MRSITHGILGTSIVIATLVMRAGHSPVRAARAAAAKGMVVHLQVSGDMHYTKTMTHAEDGGDAIPAQFSCVRFTHPNFPAKGKPPAYALSFNNPNVMAATNGVFVSFYYDPKKIADQHVEGAVEFLAVPAKYVAFGPGGEGTYTVVVHLAPDLHSGTAVATNMRNLLGAGHVTIKVSWSCPVVFARPT
jgi:hypothetical protein